MSKILEMESDQKVGFSIKLNYSLADFGANLAFQSTSLFLMFYFTDVFGLAPALAGTIFLYAKIWDAVSDPLMGMIADRTRTRWGKFRPYLLFGSFPFMLSIALLWAAPPVEQQYKFLYGLATFIFFSTAITVVNVPYQAITPSLTSSSDERASVMGFRAIFSILGTLTAAAVTLPLVNLLGAGSQQLGFRMLGMVYGLIAAGVTLLCFFAVKEKIDYNAGDKNSLRDSIRIIVRNKPFLLLCAGVLLNMTGMNILAVVINYFFKYNLGAENLISIAFLCLFVSAAGASVLWIYISKRTSKRTAYCLGMSIVIVSLVMIMLVGERSAALTIILFVFAGIGLSTNWISPWAMVADTVEYSEFVTGNRKEGILYGIFYFVQKLCVAIAGFIVGKVLSGTGYNPNMAQTEKTLEGIKYLFTLIPAILLLLGVITLVFYPLDTRMHNRIIGIIEKRKLRGV